MPAVSADCRIVRYPEPPRNIMSTRHTDTWTALHSIHPHRGAANETHGRARVAHIHTVNGPSDAQRVSEPPRSLRQLPHRPRRRTTTSSLHAPGHDLPRSHQHRMRLTVSTTHDVRGVMHPVHPIHVQMPSRPEHCGVTGCSTPPPMRRRITPTLIRLHLRNAQRHSAGDEDTPQQLGRHDMRGPGEK
jgi:hypothetical protein